MINFAQTHRRLTALVEVALGEKVTQRSLAALLEISLGLSNKLLQQLQRERLIKVQTGGDGARYAVTRMGRAATARLTRAFEQRAGVLVDKAAEVARGNIAAGASRRPKASVRRAPSKEKRRGR